MLLIIDNYDSFTYNLVQFLGELGAELKVYRNDKIALDEIRELAPEKIVLSPGPCTPKEAGICKDIVSEFGASTPTLGVCLGHQCIGEVYGGKVIRADEVMHGKTSMIHHDGRGVFDGIPNPTEATRYHSLIVERDSLPDCFEVSAWTDDIVMGLRHREHPVHGVQFHPESILTGEGMNILNNFLKM